jgi:hypothetical protein
VTSATRRSATVGSIPAPDTGLMIATTHAEVVIAN